MKEKSWACTLVTQLSLCMVAYIAINIGQPQEFTRPDISSKQNDMYFISVAGGFKPLKEQILMLQQMVNVEKTYKPRFVVQFSELGESDPIFQNATVFPELQTMPWFISGALKGKGETYFLEKIEVPYGQTLDVIALDTVFLQDESVAPGIDQIMWLKRILTESNSDWKIVIGFHQLISCGHNVWKTNDTLFEPLPNILLQYGVDVYMSMKTCDDPGNKAIYLTAMNHNLVSKEETGGGFLLHRISSLEMVSVDQRTFCVVLHISMKNRSHSWQVTSVVKLTGEIEHRSSFQQRGRAAM